MIKGTLNHRDLKYVTDLDWPQWLQRRINRRSPRKVVPISVTTQEKLPESQRVVHIQTSSLPDLQTDFSKPHPNRIKFIVTGFGDTQEKNTEMSRKTLSSSTSGPDNQTTSQANMAGTPASLSKGVLNVARVVPRWNYQAIDDIPIPGIVLAFTAPMISTVQVSNPRPSADFVSISPPIDGHWSWLDPTHLMFQPDAGTLPLGTTFGINVKEGLKALNGKSLQKSYSTSFSTSLQMPTFDTTFDPFAIVMTSKQPLLQESILPALTTSVSQPFIPSDIPNQVRMQTKSVLKLKMASVDETKKLLGDKYKKEYGITCEANLDEDDNICSASA